MVDLTAGEVRRLLSESPRPPRDPALFSADSDYCGPGIYEGPPMIPAGEDRLWAEQPESLLERHSVDPLAARKWFVDPSLAGLCPDPAVRIGLALLGGTIAEPALEAATRESTITVVAYGTPARPGRIVGTGERIAERFVNDRYRFEHPALLAGPLAHELLSSPVPRCDIEENVTHGILAMVHMQLLAVAPELAALGTELARRVNSITLSLFNSRRPGDPGFRFIAPDGPGTIPGGVERMQTSDFWSIPFLSGHGGEEPVPESVRAVFGRLGCRLGEPDSAVLYSRATLEAVDATMGTAWLDWVARGRVGQAFGVM